MDLKIIALARNWFRGRKNVLFDQTTKEIIYFELIFALLYSCLKYPFFQKNRSECINITTSKSRENVRN